MYLWKLERDADHDETAGVILTAETEADARRIAAQKSRGDQGPDAWFSPSTVVTAIGEAFPDAVDGTIHLTDFREG